MKTALIFSASLAGLLLAAQTKADTAVTSGWQIEMKVVQQASNVDSAGLTRDEAILAAVVDATRNGLKIETKTVQATESAPVGANLDAAGTQAAYSAMVALYPSSGPTLDAWLAHSLAEVNDSASAIAAGRKWGEHVAEVILAEPGDAVLPKSTTFAAEVTASASPAPASVVQAESADGIGPGRYQVTTLAGGNYWGSRDGVGASASFGEIGGIAVDAAGNVYVSELDNCTIRKITPAGVVSTLAGTPGQRGNEDGNGAEARFDQPAGLAADGVGNIYVADGNNHMIRKISPSGDVTTIAGAVHSPAFVAVDSAGNVYFDEYYSFGLAPSAPTEDIQIRKVAPDGTLTSSTVTIEPAGSRDYRLSRPQQLCVDHAGNLYAIFSSRVMSVQYSDVIKLTQTGPNHYTGTAILPDRGLINAAVISNSSFQGDATGIGLDGADQLVIRYGANSVGIYTPKQGFQYRYISSGLYGSYLWAVSGKGELYAAIENDYLAGPDFSINVGLFDPSSVGPVILKHPSNLAINVGDTAAFAVTAVGTPAPTYQWYFKSNPISGATNATLTLSSVQISDSGYYHVVVSDSGGSVISNSASLGVFERLTPTTKVTATATSTPNKVDSTTSSGGGSSSGSGDTASGGGGSLDPGSSLAALLLLAARKLRRRHRAILAVSPDKFRLPNSL